MGANSSSMQDDLSDVIPSAWNQLSSNGIDPDLLKAAQKEKEISDATGKAPPVGGAIHQLGLTPAAQAQHPAVKAAHAERVGLLPPGTAHKIAAQVGDPDVSGIHSIADAAQMQNPTPQNPAGTIGSTQGDPSQGQAAQPDLVAGFKNMMGAQKQMEDAGLKNPRSSIEDDTKSQNENSSKLRVNSPPGSYSQGSGEVQGYAYTKNPDGTYTRSDQPDPNSLFQKQQSAIQKLQELVDQRAARGQPTRPTDLTGLMMAADFENNTDRFSKAYQGQRNAQVADAQDAQKLDQQNFSDQAQALKDQEDLYKNAQTGALGIMGGGQIGSVNNLITTQKALEAAGNQKGQGNPLGEYDKWSSAVTKDPILNAAIKSSDQLYGAQQLVNSNKNISALMAKGSLLHAAFGRVNQTEYTAAGGDPGTQNTITRLWNKYNDFVSGHPDQDPTKAFTPQDQQEFRQAINTLSAQDDSTIQTRMGLYRQDAVSRGLPTSQTETVLQSLHPGRQPSPSASPPAPSKSPAHSAPPEAVAYAKKYNISIQRALQIGKEKGWIK